jgi:glycosyltransferase involved in cell wall biosynthesis
LQKIVKIFNCMHILLLHSSSDLYGASKIFLQTAQILKAQGYTCHVVVSANGPLVDKLKQDNIQVTVINLGIIRRKYFTPLGILNRINKWSKANDLLNKYIKQNGIELVYANTTAVLLGAYIAHKNKIKHVWHVHEIIEKPKFLFLAIQWIMKRYTATIICVSKSVQNHWSKNAPSLLSKMQVIYNGIGPVEKSVEANFRTQFKIPEESIVIGMAGRVHYWKGQQYLLQIAKQLLNRSTKNNPTASLYFIITGDAFPGYEYLVDEIQNFIKNNQLGDRIFYTGFEYDMDKFYSSIDILILPSQLPDPLPTVVLEAMQYGIPVVATAQGGALEMIAENETGIFIPMDDVTMAVAQIQDLIQKEKHLLMGIAAKQRVQNLFSKLVYEEKISSFFRSF